MYRNAEPSKLQLVAVLRGYKVHYAKLDPRHESGHKKSCIFYLSSLYFSFSSVK